LPDVSISLFICSSVARHWPQESHFRRFRIISYLFIYCSFLKLWYAAKITAWNAMRITKQYVVQTNSLHGRATFQFFAIWKMFGTTALLSSSLSSSWRHCPIWNSKLRYCPDKSSMLLPTAIQVSIGDQVRHITFRGGKTFWYKSVELNEPYMVQCIKKNIHTLILRTVMPYYVIYNPRENTESNAVTCNGCCKDGSHFTATTTVE